MSMWEQTICRSPWQENCWGRKNCRRNGQNRRSGKKAEADGADYVGVGAIYPTTTHDNPVRTSVDSLKAIAEAVNIGVLAIGGLTADNVHILKNTGNNGACVVRYLMQSDDVTADVKRLRDALREE